MQKFMKVSATAGAICLVMLVGCLGFGPSQAHADFVVTVSDSAGASISIDATNGTYTYSHGLNGATTGVFFINGNSESYANSSGTFTASNLSLSFESVAGNHTGERDFGNFSASITINLSPGATQSQVFDSDISAKADGVTASDLTTQMSAVFTEPLGPFLNVNNVVSSSNLVSGTATFISGVNGNNTTTASISADGSNGTSGVFPGTSPSYTVTNQLVLNNMLVGTTDNVNGTTTITAVPVPAGLVLLLSGTPMLGLGHWLRRRQVRSTTTA
jgi:hypothetical protein